MALPKKEKKKTAKKKKRGEKKMKNKMKRSAGKVRDHHDSILKPEKHEKCKKI